MKYRGSRVFYCKNCKDSYMLTREYVATQRNPVTLIKSIIGLKPSGWIKL